MNILALIVEIYLIVTGLALITTLARVLATSKEERELKKKMLKKMLEETLKQNADVMNNSNNSIIGKFMKLKINGIQEDNQFKVFIFNFVMHFIPILNVGVLLSNLNDVFITFKN